MKAYYETPWLMKNDDELAFSKEGKCSVCFSGLDREYDIDELGDRIKICVSTVRVPGAIKAEDDACMCPVAPEMECVKRLDMPKPYAVWWWVEVPA